MASLMAGLGKIVLKPDPIKETQAGVLLPDTNKLAPHGIVVVVGSVAEEQDTKPNIYVGDRVYYGGYALIYHEGVEYHVIEHYDVLASYRLDTMAGKK